MNFLTLLFLVFIGLISPLNSYAQNTKNTILIAQDKPTNLFDLLFGNQQETKKRTPTRRVQTVPRKATPKASLPTIPSIEKSPTATRLMVIGDSLAVDLSKALERFYVDDPNLVIIGQGVGSSGFVRDDFFDWDKALSDAVANDSFDIAVVMMGINDKQNLLVDGKSETALSEKWKNAYSARLNGFLAQFRAANKPVIWLGLPPMASPKYSASMMQISSLQRSAVFSSGAEFIDIYERFTDENGKYSSRGPDINGQNLVMRKSDGIHFSKAGSDKLAFYINLSMKHFYRGGAISITISDPLFGTDALRLNRPPFQGLDQIRMLEVAGAVTPLNSLMPRADQLINTGSGILSLKGVELQSLMSAPVGRADAFGVGIDLNGALEEKNN